MNLLQELRALDPRDPGRWPLAVRAGAVGVCFVVVALLAAYFFVWTDLNPQLQQLQDQEVLAHLREAVVARHRETRDRRHVGQIGRAHV